MPHDIGTALDCDDAAPLGGGTDTFIDTVDARLIEHLHGGFPLTDRPFADVAAALGCGEDEVIERLRRLLAQGVLTRFGPLFQIERAGGCFVLAAIAVPEECPQAAGTLPPPEGVESSGKATSTRSRFAAVTAIVNARPEVAHNYRREHALNMWFVVATETPAAADAVLDRIEADTGLAVWRFPKEREFAVELMLPITEAARVAV